MPARTPAFFAPIGPQGSQAIRHFWNGKPMVWPAVVVIEDDESGAAIAYRYAADGRFAGDTWHETHALAEYALSHEYGNALGSWQPIPAGVPALQFREYALEHLVIERSGHVRQPDQLTTIEREFLVDALAQWGGPAHANPYLSKWLGLASPDELYRHAGRMRNAIEAGRSLPAADWRRALLLAELAFASDVSGAGVEWSTVTGRSDSDSLSILRSIQRKLAGLSADT